MEWVMTRLLLTARLSSGDHITHFTERKNNSNVEYASKPSLMKKMPFKQICHKARGREGGGERNRCLAQKNVSIVCIYSIYTFTDILQFRLSV